MCFISIKTEQSKQQSVRVDMRVSRELCPRRSNSDNVNFSLSFVVLVDEGIEDPNTI